MGQATRSAGLTLREIPVRRMLRCNAVPAIDFGQDHFAISPFTPDNDCASEGLWAADEHRPFSVVIKTCLRGRRGRCVLLITILLNRKR